MEAWLAGFIGGLLGTVALTAIMLPVREEPPGPSFVLSRLTGDDPNSMRIVTGGMLVHFAYGGVAGLFFGALVVGFWEWTQFLWAWGILLGIVLFVIDAVWWAPITGMRAQLEAMPGGQRFRTRMVLAISHVAYGAILGEAIQLLAVSHAL